MLLLAATAYAKPPEGADPALAPWYQSLRTPDGNMGCCSIADCRPTDYRQTRDGYEVLIDDRWLAVPPEKILERISNPTGRAVVCYTPALGILCFVRPAET